MVVDAVGLFITAILAIAVWITIRNMIRDVKGMRRDE